MATTTVIATNRRARHLYAVLDTLEAGVMLVGTEVKSLRLGRVSLVDAFATIDDGEVWLRGLHINEYAMGTWTNHTPRRVRKLLLNRREIDRWDIRVRESGLSLIPMSMYFSDGRAKVELALVKGKKTWDKRQDLATRDANREIEREFARHVKGQRR
ncbi:SsrA-binding protein [Actinokineospora alba]|uniref:SsrA-binding protein n=2 Tax=Actinokineospora TaxID=39845 RepID=A0A1H0VL57_9PSEU|nr:MULTISPECIES: SsrA-binding protein SmpB [Actinokineospora]MBC6448119.1 SsrA-binding protein SmpB [Actinokineospora xionganensis]TDP67669.1 SsrA-binding protein [Actinokineospora alba]SDJ28795.1 SsrA-binding protein [Actinokineospora alba]SDP78786.1 SsrA-binding protein [Actinokineospora alba]